MKILRSEREKQRNNKVKFPISSLQSARIFSRRLLLETIRICAVFRSSLLRSTDFSSDRITKASPRQCETSRIRLDFHWTIFPHDRWTGELFLFFNERRKKKKKKINRHVHVFSFYFFSSERNWIMVIE